MKFNLNCSNYSLMSKIGPNFPPSLTLFDGIGIEKHNNKNPKK